ncbi:lasso RiPP family leader peptide-containing protein [Nocardiopsis suaedae]|uniref:Lasso RiPP family leader peptide-containing protein n=1 Tax=Nocardiopsis suaedae TaxID=3018444 RepID=A0ABT4TFC3_9ACTN|nr:lasso RiPP family leader peptide-containing protein [Nocardiopsis suaedae]MDA2803410.1 lasso RiPP family leader peptide-containing protein [Nocardiopsis suaedae]
MREYTEPALTELGDFRGLTLGGGPIPIWDSFLIGVFA